jgi:hypothetical protein
MVLMRSVGPVSNPNPKRARPIFVSLAFREAQGEGPSGGNGAYRSLREDPIYSARLPWAKHQDHAGASPITRRDGEYPCDRQRRPASR